MIDNKSRYYYEIDHEMPQINIYNANNLNMILDVYALLIHYNQEPYNRAIIFVSITTIIYSVQFLFICAQILLFKNPLENIGSNVFIAYSIYNFIVTLIMVLIMIYYGAEANMIDYSLKEFLSKMKKDCISIKT